MPGMDFLRLLLILLHFLGCAALLAGFRAQVSESTRRVTPGMLHGALTQLVTGVALIGVDQGVHHHLDDAKLGVKLAVLVVILLLAWVNRAKAAVSNAVFFAIGGLTVANVAVAVFWT